MAHPRGEPFTVPLSLTLGVIALEVGLRLYHGELFNFGDLRKTDTFRNNSPAQYDPTLGYVYRPGVHIAPGGTSFSITEHGFRTVPTSEATEEWPILAVGNSFTFGEEVDDHETWPAELAHIMERQVINARVPGYGIDQTVLSPHFPDRS